MAFLRRRARVGPLLSALLLLAAAALAGSALLATAPPTTEAAIPKPLPRMGWETDLTNDPLASSPRAAPTSMFKRNGTIYAVGGFSMLGRWTTGPLVLVNPDTGEQIGRMPLISGKVYSVVEDGAGGWFVGGWFYTLSDPKLSSLIHIRADRTLDMGWQTGLNLAITRLARSGNTLYYVSDFSVNNSPTVVGSIDIPSGKPTAWHPALTLQYSDAVSQIAVSGTTVLLGVEVAGKTTVLGVSAASGQITWRHDTDDRADIFDLLVDGPTLYVGGSFKQLGGQPRTCLAAVDTASGRILPLSLACDLGTLGLFSGGPPPTPVDPRTYIHSLAKIGNQLYLAGSFPRLNGQTRDKSAAITLPAGTLTPWQAHLDNFYHAIAAYNNRIYALTTTDAAALDPVSGQPVWHKPGLGGAFGLSGQGMLVGGIEFRYGMEQTGVVALNASSGSWRSLGEWWSSLLRTAHDDDTIYKVAMDRNDYEGMPYYISALRIDTGALPGWPPPKANGDMAALQPAPGRLYVGGSFTEIEHQARPGLAALTLTPNNPARWASLADWTPQLPAGAVTNLLLQGDTLYVAVRTDPATIQIVALDTASGAPSGWSATVAASEINALLISGATLYASGAFQTPGGPAGVAAFDLTGQAAPVYLLPGASAHSPVLRDTTLIAVSAGRVKLIDLASGAASDWGGETGHVLSIADGGDELLVRWCNTQPGTEPYPFEHTVICGIKTFPYASAAAATGPADGLSGASITLHGIVTPNDSPVNAFFQVTTQPGNCSALRTVAARPRGR